MYCSVLKIKRRLRTFVYVGSTISIVLVIFFGTKTLQFINERKPISKSVNKPIEVNLKKKFLQKLTGNHINSFGNQKFKPVLPRPSSYTPTGLGEYGVEVKLKNLNETARNEEKKSLSQHGINQFLSERISLHRTLKDPRPPSCLEHPAYDYSKFPSTSIVVIFFNEGLSTLLRTIYSILHNTADSIMVELILIDDCSDMPHLKKPLEDNIKNLPKVRLIRNDIRSGIVRSRLIGLDEANGEVIAFVDSHCECTVGWLEPLLVSILEDNATLAVPVTDDIDSATFQYYYGSYEPNIGGFTWDMFFHWRPISSKQRKNRKSYAEPIRTPTISGGLFAVNKKYFQHIGSYDSQMDVWGGENVELSFRTWMCGGRILIHPCSHIGHVSRNKEIYSREPVWKNVKRTAEVLLDGHYKELFYSRLVKSKHNLEYGDVTERKQLIRNLKCHDFKWYLDNVFPEKYVPENRKGFSGTIQSQTKPTHCLDRSGDQFVLYVCHGFYNQFFELNKVGQLRNNDDCLKVDANQLKITVQSCPEVGDSIPPNSRWSMTKEGLLRHASTNLCLEKGSDKFGAYSLEIKTCDAQNILQRWRFQVMD